MLVHEEFGNTLNMMIHQHSARRQVLGLGVLEFHSALLCAILVGSINKGNKHVEHILSNDLRSKKHAEHILNDLQIERMF